MEYIGDGTLFAVLENQNIQSLSHYGLPSFLSLSTGLSLPYHINSGICRHENADFSIYDGKTSICDFSQNGCFVRYVETTKPLCFQLLIPPHCRRYWYPDCKIGRQASPSLLLSVPAGTPSPDGFCTVKEHRMLVTAWGQSDFSEDGTKIRLFPGRTALLFVTGKAGELISLAGECIKALEAPTVSQSRLFQKAFLRGSCRLCDTERAAWDTLCQLTDLSGGTLSGHDEGRVFLADMPLVGQAFLHLKDLDRAKNAALFLLAHLEKSGHLPLVMSASTPCLGTEETGMERMLYPAVCHFFLDLAEQKIEPVLSQRLRVAALRLFCQIKAAAASGTLGFSGVEFSMRRGHIPTQYLLHGNLLATAQYIHLAGRLGKSENDPIPTAIDCYRTDFGESRLPKTDSIHRLARMRLPKAVYGTCTSCGDFPYVGWLCRSAFGTYLCPRCLEKGQKEHVLSAKEPLSLGAYAAAAEHLFFAGLKNEAEYHRDVEICMGYIADDTPFYDLALLCSMLLKIGSPHYQTVKERLQTMQIARKTPLYAPEAAVYLLASKSQ